MKNQNQIEIPKQARFKTAIATISCAHFKAGDCVSVQWTGREGQYGTHWFAIHETQNGKLDRPVMPPQAAPWSR